MVESGNMGLFFRKLSEKD